MATTFKIQNFIKALNAAFNATSGHDHDGTDSKAIATQTGLTLTSPVITSPDVTQGVSSHSYGTGHADWTLSAAEMKTKRLIATGTADAGVSAIATPTAGKEYMILNTSGQALTFKATGQTGVTIASTKSAIVIGNGTDFVRVTADA